MVGYHLLWAPVAMNMHAVTVSQQMLVMCVELLRSMSAEAYGSFQANCMGCAIARHYLKPRLSLASLQVQQTDLTPLAGALGKWCIHQKLELGTNLQTTTTSLTYHNALNTIRYTTNITERQCMLVWERL